MTTVRSPDLWDVLTVLLCFLGLISPGLGYVLWREWRTWKEWKRRYQAEAEADAAEGFPPPGPPTTDHPSR